jgi:hypothetical protein
MFVRNKSKRLLIIGIIGCLLYVIGDSCLPRPKRTDDRCIGFMVRVAYLEMVTWRMGGQYPLRICRNTPVLHGFSRMYGLLKIHVTEDRDRKWVRLFASPI